MASHASSSKARASFFFPGTSVQWRACSWYAKRYSPPSPAGKQATAPNRGSAEGRATYRRQAILTTSASPLIDFIGRIDFVRSKVSPLAQRKFGDLFASFLWDVPEKSRRHPLVLCPSVNENPSVRYELIKKIEVRDVAGEHWQTELAPLQINQRVVERSLFGADSMRSQAKQKSSQNPRRPPRRRVGRDKAMCWDSANRLPDHLERSIGSRIARTQAPKCVGKFS